MTDELLNPDGLTNDGKFVAVIAGWCSRHADNKVTVQHRPGTWIVELVEPERKQPILPIGRQGMGAFQSPDRYLGTGRTPILALEDALRERNLT